MSSSLEMPVLSGERERGELFLLTNMAAVLSPTRSLPPPAFPPAAFCSRFRRSCFLTDQSTASSVMLHHRPILPHGPHSRPGLCLSASPGPGPPPDDGPLRLQGIGSSLSKLQSTVQIFFAVLFWMSLFFWASAWDGRNRPDKGQGFRR